jgi:hypothetical protein
MLISKYGFMDILSYGRVVLDPSRVAAQVVSGIGFIGGGIIFMRRDVVRGLTTAASVMVHSRAWNGLRRRFVYSRNSDNAWLCRHHVDLSNAGPPVAEITKARN